MTPAGLVDLAKRTSRSGTLGNNADQTAIDLLAHLNLRLYKIWRFHAWDWSLDDISLSVGPSTYNHTLPSTSGDQYELNIQGQVGILRRYTRKQYLAWEKQANVSDTSSLIGYVPLGRDASGNIKLRFFSAPAVAVTVEGWAKKRLVKLTTADWATELPYFPVEMQDVVFDFLLADAYKLMGDERAAGQERMAQASLVNLRGDVEGPPDADPQSPPPDYIKFVSRNRGRGTGVV